MSRLTPVEKEQRSEFVLQRLKRGFSFLEVQRQFKKEYEVHTQTARQWVNWACDQISEQEDNSTRKRVYSTVVEMYHDQIVSYQNELLGMQKEIDVLTKIVDLRNSLIEEISTAPWAQRKGLTKQLESLPEVHLTAKSGLIEAKSRIRERMYRVMTDLARLRGFTGLSSDWRGALNTLLDNNLLPPNVADGILTLIDVFEGNIRSMDTLQAPQPKPSEPGEDDLDLPDPSEIEDYPIDP